jgi:hypothetical protein
MLTALDHAPQAALIPAEEINRRAVFVFRALWHAPVKGELCDARQIPSGPRPVVIVFWGKGEAGRIHTRQYKTGSEEGD